MELAFLIYTLIFVFTLAFSFIGVNAARWHDNAGKYWKTWIYWSIAILFYTLILGLRENVGFDYISYKNVFTGLTHSGGDLDGVDLIYYIFLPVVQGIHYNIFIAFLAFVVILFLFLSLKERSKILLLYVFLFFTLLPFFISINIMRQSAAMFVLFYAINKFLKFEYIKFIFFYFFAFLIHKSCIILLPFIIFIRGDLFKYRWVQLALLISSSLYGGVVFERISEILRLISLPDFLSLYQEQYIESFDFRTERSSDIGEASKNTGFFPLFIFFINILIIVFSKKLKESYKNYYFIFFYNIYFLGVILQNIFSYNEGFDRLVQYFTFYRIYIFSIFLHYTFFVYSGKYLIFKFIPLIVMPICLIFFYMVIYRGAMGISPFAFL